MERFDFGVCTEPLRLFADCEATFRKNQNITVRVEYPKLARMTRHSFVHATYSLAALAVLL
jgi:hypothetical protein